MLIYVLIYSEKNINKVVTGRTHSTYVRKCLTKKRYLSKTYLSEVKKRHNKQAMIQYFHEILADSQESVCGPTEKKNSNDKNGVRMLHLI